MKTLESKSLVLLRHHLKALRLPTIGAECEKAGMEPQAAPESGVPASASLRVGVVLAAGRSERLRSCRPGGPPSPWSRGYASGAPRVHDLECQGPQSAGRLTSGFAGSQSCVPRVAGSIGAHGCPGRFHAGWPMALLRAGGVDRPREGSARRGRGGVTDCRVKVSCPGEIRPRLRLAERRASTESDDRTCGRQPFRQYGLRDWPRPPGDSRDFGPVAYRFPLPPPLPNAARTPRLPPGSLFSLDRR